jgi:hypothetical protein
MSEDKFSEIIQINASQYPMKFNPMLVKLAISALIIFAMYAASLITLNRMVAQATPPEGFIFERLPVLTGVYEYSEPNNRPQIKLIAITLAAYLQILSMVLERWDGGGADLLNRRAV